jgi:N-acetylglucosamine-6-phosphate deacetylase
MSQDEGQTITIVGGAVYTPQGVIAPGVVSVRDGIIVAIEPQDEGARPRGPTIDATGLSVVPGLIDLHIHGLLGHDGMGPQLRDLARALPSFGVTAFLATTIPRPRPQLLTRLRAMARVIAHPPPDGAPCLGIHLEGPFLSSAQAGVAEESWFEPWSEEAFQRFQDAAGGRIRMLTLAPEVGAETMHALPGLRQAGVVPSIGHSNATFAQVRRAVELGLRHASHTFNAMRAFHHREPGVAGAVLFFEQLVAQAIADGVHLHPATLTLLWRLKGPRGLVLVSDAAPPAALPPGTYRWDERTLVVADGACRRPDGTLAGSHTPLDGGLRHLVHQVGVPLAEALPTVTATPARVLNLPRRGCLAPGARADVVLLDPALRPVRTLIAGRQVFPRPSI